MARRNDKRRIVALGNDPLAFRREAPKESMEIHMLEELNYGVRATIVGRIMLTDRTGKISNLGLFSTIDGKDVIILEQVEGNGASIPVYLLRTAENVEYVNSTIHYGDVVMISGEKLQVGKEDAFLGETVELLSKALGNAYDGNINLDERSGLYHHRHLQLIREPDTIAHFRKCSFVFQTIRQFLYKEGYEELSLTLLQESFEAGLANPFTTYVNGRNQDMYLRLTSELMLRKLMMGGFSKVFEIGKSFRNQGSTDDMCPQFNLLELYRAYGAREEMEDLIREMLCELVIGLHGSMLLPTAEGLVDFAGAWPAYDFKEEVEKDTGLVYDETLPVNELASILDRVGIERPQRMNKRNIAVKIYSHVMAQIRGPAFLRNLPAAQTPLFKLNGDGSTVDETYLVVNGDLVADLVNAERDPLVIRRRMEEQLAYRNKENRTGLNEDFIDAMRYGLPPCRGIGMGIERLLMLLLNKEKIREVELFPVF